MREAFQQLVDINPMRRTEEIGEQQQKEEVNSQKTKELDSWD